MSLKFINGYKREKLNDDVCRSLIRETVDVSESISVCCGRQICLERLCGCFDFKQK